MNLVGQDAGNGGFAIDVDLDDDDAGVLVQQTFSPSMPNVTRSSAEDGATRPRTLISPPTKGDTFGTSVIGTRSRIWRALSLLDGEKLHPAGAASGLCIGPDLNA